MQETAELFVRRATFAPKSIDEQARTARLVWSTGAPVQRRDMDGAYVEVLSLDPAHVRLDKLKGGPLLDTHKQWSLGNVLGVVTNAGVDGGEGWADVKFSKRAEVEPIWRDVRDGIIRSVSVGYSVAKWADSKDAATGLRKRTATDWTPREISLVPLPADTGATIRSNVMAEEVITQTAPPAENRGEINKGIRSIATIAGLTMQFADGLIDRGATVDQARAAAFEEMGKRGKASIQNQRVEVLESHDAPDKLVGRMTEALHCRVQPGKKPSDEAKPYMNFSILGMARALLVARGERGVDFWSPDDVLRRAHTTSDFPNLLTGTGNRVLLGAFQAAPNPLKTLARQALISDFRPKTAIKLGAMGKLPKVNEKGELKNTTRAEAKESYSLDTFGEIFSLSRKAIINDDLGAFNDWSVAMGRAAAETEADQLVTLLTVNGGAGPEMDDGHPLFHSTHGNLSSVGDYLDGNSGLYAARKAMRQQTDLDGVTPINSTPRYLLVGPELETAAEMNLAELYPTQVSDVNPMANNRLALLVEPRLSGVAWYLFADPALQPVLEYAYLTSAQGPQMASREGWDVLGMEFRVTLDFGCGAVDHRGAYRNPGKTSEEA
jgi:hypothetical protein